jgi:hypothetical protein
MDKWLAGISIVWAVGVMCFMCRDLIGGLRSKKMAGIAGGSGVTMTNVGSGSITLGGSTTTKIKVESPMVATNSLMLGEVDVGESLKLFKFFLQSRHPEIFEEYEAIRKIKES